MSKLSLPFSSLWLMVMVFLLVSVWHFWPFLQHPAFNVIDDGMSLQVAQRVISSSDFSGLFEVENGRVRPMYWLYFVAVYFLSELNPMGYWLMQSMLFASTLFLLWFIVSYEMEPKKLTTVLFAVPLLGLLFVPAVTENIFRLGTAEVRQGILFLFAILWMMFSISHNKKRAVLGSTVLMFALLTKETSLLIIPMAVIYFLPFIVSQYQNYKQHLCTLVLLCFLGLLFFSLVSALKETSEYSSGFQVSLMGIKTNLLISRLQMNELWYAMTMLFGSTLSRFALSILKNSQVSLKKRQSLWSLLTDFWRSNALVVTLIVGLMGSLFFVFSWEYQLERYYYLTYLFLFLYLVLELQKGVEIIRSSKKRLQTVLILIGTPLLLLIVAHFIFFHKTLPQLRNYLQRNAEGKQRWFGDYQNSYSIIEALLLEENISALYVMVDDYEVIYELGLFANKLDFKANQISIFSPNIELSEKDARFIYAADVVQAFTDNSDPNKLLVTTEKLPVELEATDYEQQTLTSDFLDQHSDRPRWILWRERL